MDALGIERAHLVGNSMGGRVAIEVGLRAPERVGALGLLCPAVAFVARGYHPIVRLLRPELGRAAPPLRPRHASRSQFWSLFADRDLVDPSVADIVVDEFQRIYGSAGARLAFLAAARNDLSRAARSAATASTRGWPSCEPPALFVWGSHDQLIPAALRPPRRASGCRAPSRSCSRAAATCPRSSARSRRTGCSQRFFARADALGGPARRGACRAA